MALSGKINGEVLHGKAEIPGLVPGPSAYEVAVKNGFKGTEAEWLASLKGADGADGEKGEKGDGIPPIHAEDADKVLTANADGTAEWKRHGALYDGTVTATDTGNGNVLGNLGVAISLTQGAAYKVTFNGIDYKCVGSKEDIYPYLGNAHFLNDSREDTGEPFCLMFATNTTYLKTNAAGSYTLIIYEATSGVGIAITEVTSPDQITADSPDGFYIVPGGEGGGGSTGGTPIHYYDSLDAVPADLPEGSFVAVPSSGESGESGVKVIDLTKYVATGSYTFNDLVLNAFSSGGGVVEFTDSSSFWTDVNADENIKLMLDISLLAPNTIIEAAPAYLLRNNGIAAAVQITIIIYGREYMRGSILIEKLNSDKTSLLLYIEPLVVENL